MKRKIIGYSGASFWVVLSEFVRNEFLYKGYWLNHFDALGLKFETLPINGMLWMVWSIALVYVIQKLLSKFSVTETLTVTWISAFFMMWITVFNLQVLPLKLLFFAIPLSLLEIFIAIVIIKKIEI